VGLALRGCHLNRSQRGHRGEGQYTCQQVMTDTPNGVPMEIAFSPWSPLLRRLPGSCGSVSAHHRCSPH
jgi:hypothetical protein